MKAIKPIFLAFLAAVIIKLFFFDFIKAEGHSMEPAIHNGDILIISRLTYGVRFPGTKKYFIRWAQPKDGEIVVFYTPEGELAVKRCAVLPDSLLYKKLHFYAQGDNDISSYDSRAYGQVSAENIIGKVLGR